MTNPARAGTQTDHEQLIAALEAVAAQIRPVADRSGAEALPTLPTGATGDTADTGDWTANEVMGHLCDAARLWGARMRRVIYETNPTLTIFDENEFVQLAAYRYVPLALLARELLLVSVGNTDFLRSLTPEQWERTGTHPERGPLSLRAIVEIEANHEQGHLTQLKAALGEA
ncbi:MAG: DinB family protein [Ktedonobacterales bacterium]